MSTRYPHPHCKGRRGTHAGQLAAHQLHLKCDLSRIDLLHPSGKGSYEPMDRIRSFLIVPFELQRVAVETIAPSAAPRKRDEHVSLPAFFLCAAGIAPEDIGFTAISIHHSIPPQCRPQGDTHTRAARRRAVFRHQGPTEVAITVSYIRPPRHHSRRGRLQTSFSIRYSNRFRKSSSAMPAVVASRTTTRG